MFMRTIELIYHRLVYKLCPQLLFPPKKSFVKKVLPSLVEKTMTTYVQPTLVDYISTTYTFDLWVSNGTKYVFIVLVIIIASDQEVKHVIIELFEISNMSGVAMAFKLEELLDKFSLTQKILPFIKDERSNLQTCVNALTFIVSCNNLSLLEPFDGTCFRHALSKVCHFIIKNEKLSISLLSTFINAM